MKLTKRIITLLFLWALYNTAAAQYNSTDAYKRLLDIENSNSSNLEKLQQVENLKKLLEKWGVRTDSVYARTLHRIGFLKFTAEKKYSEAINFTAQAIRINLSGARNVCPSFAANSFVNIGYYYNSLPTPDYINALVYFDSAIQIALQFPQSDKFFYEGHLLRSSIFFNVGNYEEALDEAILGLGKQNNKFADKIAALHYQAAIAQVALGEYKNSLPNIVHAQNYYYQESNNLELAKCATTNAYAMAGMHQLQNALQSFAKAGQLLQTIDNPDQASSILLDIGRFYLDSLNDLSVAKKYFSKVIALYSEANYAPANLLAAFNNLGLCAFKEKNFSLSLQWYQKAYMAIFSQPISTSVFDIAAMQEIKLLPDKKTILITLGNKAEMLLLVYKQTHQPQYLAASLKAFMLADSVVTDMRHNQTGEKSKLYWRNITRNLYQQALETCFITGDYTSAFYFMEKGRAALLNDRLNELGAGLRLPVVEAAREQTLKMAVAEYHFRLSNIAETDVAYPVAQQQLLAGTQQLERYIDSLEKNFPAYHQYKYADQVPSVSDLQQYLQRNGRQWVQYFVSDTLLFVLYATGKEIKLYRQPVKILEQALIIFQNNCVDKNWQNRNFGAFVQAAASLYDTILRPLQLKPGSLIISPDNIIIPFDVLCTDSKSRRMLVQDFAVSYAYSASTLLKPLIYQSKAKGSFFGMAPVSFPAAMQLSPLHSSQTALQSLKKYYPDSKLLFYKEATRLALLKNISDYTIVNLYTHARGGNDSTQPQLFLSDSAISLSELQVIQHPATQLVILSACQTNSGRLASGEGVYTIARGFAMVGIPSAVATLWNADEQATYFISGAFQENLCAGMAKDVALQQAKLAWIERSNTDGALPFYWANLTLMGNADPIALTNNSNYWWYGAVGIFSIVALCLFWCKKKKRKSKTFDSSH